MKKITGKATALVLALALVVTSFSSTFAFASTKSVTGTVSDTDKDEIYLVNDNGGKSVDLKGWIIPELDTKDHQDVDANVDITAISHASGDSLVKWKIDEPNDGDAQLTVKSTSKTGTEVLSVLYESNYTNDDGDEVTVKARKNFTVHVLDKDSIVIGKVYDSGATATGRDGKELEAPDTFAMTANSAVDIAAYKVVPDTATAVATYEKVDLTSSKTPVGNAYYVELTGDSVHLPAAIATTPAQDLTVNVLKSGYANASVANVTVTVKAFKDGKPSTSSDDKYTLKTKIEKKVDVAAAISNYNAQHTSAPIPAGTHNFSIDTNKGTKLYLNKLEIATATDAELAFDDASATISADDGSVKKISGTIDTLTINDDASIGSVDVTGDVKVDGGKVGDVSADTGAVEVTSGKVGNIDTDGTVTVEGGTVGTIDTDAAISIKSTDEDTPLVTGKVTGKSVTINSDEAKVTVAGVTVTGDDATIGVVGSNVTVGTVDFDYYDATLTLGDEDDGEFVGTIAAPVNAVNGKVATENEDTVATVTGTLNVDTLSIAEDSIVTLSGATTVDTVDGDGVLKIAAGSLYVTGSVSSATLKLTDANLAVGTTVFKADTDAVDVDDFNTYGFTLDKSAGTNVDTFKIKTLTLAGLQINKSSSKIAKGYSETFTASAYPAGTVLPTGSTVKWELDGNDDVFAVTTSGNTATVKVNSVDANFASENTATLTATLYDADGYVLDDYDAAEVKLTAIAVPEATSDTTKDFSVAQGGKYTFKITSTTAPSFTLGTAGVFTSALTKQSGNDYFYTITATGAVGKATGVYLNGTKLLVASVKAPVANFKSDTTTAIKVAAGKSYTYKITSTTAPSFGFGTTGVFTVSGITKSGNDYFYKVTAVGKAGAATGVFVNGVKVNVATVG